MAVGRQDHVHGFDERVAQRALQLVEGVALGADDATGEVQV
jgi:hypothetical protein